MKNSIKILSTGPMTLLQDLGRRGFEEYGVSVSGVADREAFNISNRLVFNKENDTVIEIFFGNTSLKFFGNNIVAISGADLGAEINGIKCPINISFVVINTHIHIHLNQFCQIFCGGKQPGISRNTAK